MTTPSGVLLADGLHKLGIEVSQPRIDALLAFVALLVKWNRVHNLTAVRTADAMIVRHLLDSAALLPWLQHCLTSTRTDVDALAKEPAEGSAKRAADSTPLVLDIGTGAGLPVIPLALLMPYSNFLSVESNGKKCRFQRQAIIELGIGNVTIHEGRIETLACQADVVMARAFTSPTRFLALARERCRAAGHAFVLLGSSERLPDPLPACWELAQLARLQVPGLGAERHLAICHSGSGFDAANGLHSET